jgi:hypothetical protein
LEFLSGVHPASAKILLQIGLEVKTEESLLTTDLETALCMSWHMENISKSSIPIVVGWKPTEEIVKSFILPERLLNYDNLSRTTAEYLGEILICLYILGYWNVETREFLCLAWQHLWEAVEDPPETIRLLHIRDFEQKTGLLQKDIDPVETTSMQPYPPEKIVKLWLGIDNPQLVTRFATRATTKAQAARSSAALAKFSVEPQAPTISELSLEDCDFDDREV